MGNRMSHIEFIQKNDIGYIILNRPQKRNALSFDSLSQLVNIIDSLKSNKKVKVVIIKGNGKDFCSGHDLSEFINPKRSVHYYRRIFSLSVNFMESIHYLPQIIIAQVHGHASAAGCQLVASCDLAVAEKNALFSTPGVKIGLFCSTPMVPLSRTIGRKRAFEMLFTGKNISSEQAMQYGLINKVVDMDDLEIETNRLAEDISKYSQIVLSLGKQTFYKQINLSETSGYNLSKEIISLNSIYSDAQEGILALLEKRPPKWSSLDDEENS